MGGVAAMTADRGLCASGKREAEED